MPTINLNLDEPAWPDLPGKNVIHYTDPIAMSALAAGMESGQPSVAFRFDLPDGSVVIAESSLAVLTMAVRGIGAKFDVDLCPGIEPTVEVGVATLLAVIPPEINITTATGVKDGTVRSVAVLIGDDGEHYQAVEADSLPGAVMGLVEKVRVDIERHHAEGHDGAVH